MRKKAFAAAKNIVGITKTFLRLVKSDRQAKNKRIKKPEIRNPIHGFNESPYKPCPKCWSKYPRGYSECPNCARLRQYRHPEIGNSRMSSGAY